MSSLPSITLGANVYKPTSPRTGSSGQTLLRLQNIMLAGSGENVYLRCYKGSLDIDESIPTLDLTGTLTGVEGASSIVGSGTSFTAELRSGQWIWVSDDPLMVNQIIDDTHLTVYSAITTAFAGATGERMPILYEMARQRATQIQGSGIQFDKGSIEAAGWGTLRLNGSVLPGTSMVLTGSPKIAIFDPLTNTYAVYDIGFDTPTVAPTLTAAGGGTKGMVAGDYSIRLVPSSSVTQGYSNPGPRANVTLTVADQRIQVDVNSVPMDTAAGQDQWDVYATQLGVVNVNQGPWNFVRSVPASEIAAGIFFIEYLGAEIARQGELEFDNDPPPDAGFVWMLQGNPQWGSCFGKWSGSPGPSLVPAVPQNVEAAPAIWNVTSSPPEDILGGVSSLARIYLLCPQTLQQAVYAPTGDPLVPPTQIRPYWSMGFSNPEQLIFALGVLIGFPHGGPTRSIADAETVDAQFLGADVAELIQRWTEAHVLVERDPSPLVNAACFFHPANAQNAAGFWTTEVLLWSFDSQAWVGSVLLSNDEKDFVVCSAATIDNQLYFLAGGRDGADIVFQTYKWNVVSGETVDYYAAWALQNGNILDRNKTVRAIKVNGKLTSAQAMIFGFDSATSEDLTNLETGTNPQVTISLGTTDTIETSPRIPFIAPNNFTFTCRISGTYNGTDEIIDQINGVELEYMTQGVRR